MKYIVNEEEKVVIAILENTENDAIDFLWSNFRHIPHFEQIIEDGYANATTLRDVEFGEIEYDALNSLKLRRYFMGKAKVHGTDTFDVETGKKIAMRKAKYKHDRALYSTVMKVLNHEYTSLMDAMSKMEYKINKSMEDMAEIEDI